jgi:hypothetical protein
MELSHNILAFILLLAILATVWVLGYKDIEKWFENARLASEREDSIVGCFDSIEPELIMLEAFVYDPKNIQDFENKFCAGGEVIAVWFNPTAMRAEFMLEDGPIATKSFPIAEALKWMADTERYNKGQKR